LAPNDQEKGQKETGTGSAPKTNAKHFRPPYLIADDIQRADRLAATDVFVEKAQGILTSRSRKLFASGAACALLATSVLLAGAVALYKAPQPAGNIEAAAATLVILRNAAIGAFIAGGAGFLIYLSRALFHESTVLLNRRHALRFGRLYVYLCPDAVTIDTLERAFKWTGEFATAFRDMRHELPKGVVDLGVKAFDTAADVAKSVAGTAAKGTSSKVTP
jgi:hypothetical protein